MKKIYFLLMGVCLLTAGLVNAQEDVTVTIKDTMLDMKKRKIILEYMDLTEAEKAAFWSLYEDYYKEINPIETETLLLLSLCSSGEVSEKDMEKYSKRMLLNDLILAKIRKQYFVKFKSGLSSLRASQFLQFDDSFRMMMRYEAQQAEPNFTASVQDGRPVLIN